MQIDESTTTISSLKMQISSQKQRKNDRNNLFEEHRQKNARAEFEELINQFDQQCCIIDENYREKLIDEADKENDENKFFAQIYERDMLANEDEINIDVVKIIEEK